MEKTHTHIESVISKRKPGDLFFPSDFRGIGTHVAIKQALSRLTRAGKLRRLGHGIYYLPKLDPQLGELLPAAEDVVKILAKKERVRIRPAGAYALHSLGLTAQVPTKLVYLTDGNPKLFRLGKIQVRFKPTSPKKLYTKGQISSLVIQAIEELGVKAIDKEIEKKIAELLRKENPKILKEDLSLVPAKINDYIVKLLKKPVDQHDSMATNNS